MVPDPPPRVSPPKQKAAGAAAVASSLNHVLRSAGATQGTRALLGLNQVDGFDCPSCAWPDPDEHRTRTEFCENGAKAVADEKVSSDNKKNFKPSSILKEQLKNVEQIKTQEKNDLETKIVTSKTTQIKSPKDLIFLVEKNREIELKYDLERNVKIANFEDGKIDINFNENLNKNFIKKLSQSLYEWTGKRWIISLSKEENLKTFHQAKIDKKEESLSKEKKSETFQNMLKIFPDADLTDIRTEKEDE